MIRQTLLFTCLLTFIVVSTTFAFDPRTHVWVAQQVLNDVLDDGKVKIDGHDYRVPAEIVDAMTRHPEFYRMGHVGPDAHPDIIVGQTFLHPGTGDPPGTGDKWGADKWGKWIHDQARLSESKEALAYAAGYWGHLAGDIVAHSYINTYAGDYFLLFDQNNLESQEQEVELRHFVLEHYIGDRTPPLKDNDNEGVPNYKTSLKTPSEFLATTLILNDTVADQYLKSPALAGHLLAMYRLHKSVHDLRVAVERFEKPLDAAASEIEQLGVKCDKLLGDTIEEIAKLTPSLNPLVTEVARLQGIVDKQSKLNEQVENAAAATAQAAVDATRELARIDEQIRNNTHELEDKVVGEISRLERAHTKLDKQLRRWKDEIRDQRDSVKRLESLRSRLGKEVDRLEGKLSRWVRHVPGLGTAKDKLDKAKAQLAKAERNLETARDNAEQIGRDLEKNESDLSGQVSKRASLQTAIEQLSAARGAAERARKTAVDAADEVGQSLEDARKALAENLQPLDVASEELRRLQNELKSLKVREDELKTEIQERYEELQGLLALQHAFFRDEVRISSLLADWETDLVRAASAYIVAAGDVLVGTMNGDEKPLQPLVEWYECWAPVFTGIPSSASNAVCDTKAYLREVSEKLAKTAEALAMKLPLVSDLVSEIEKLREQIKQAAVDAAIEFADHALGESFTKFYVAGSPHTDDDLNKVYRTDSSGKQLLTFPNMANIIKLDLGMSGDAKHFDPFKFQPAIHAVTLAKLTLLDADGMDEIADVYKLMVPSHYKFESASPDRERFLYPDKKNFTNILFRAVRSIDGNQQWRGNGLPYIRRNDSCEVTNSAPFGYSEKEDGKDAGFRMWVDTNYRSTVFAKMFPGEMKLASLAPGIASFIPRQLQKLEDEGSGGDCKTAEPKNAAVPEIRDAEARAELENTRSLEIEEVASVQLLDRVDGKSRDQVNTALREEGRQELLQELRHRQHWGNDYRVERKKAVQAGKPIFLVIEGRTPSARFSFDALAADELQENLLKPFVLCKSGVDSQGLRQILSRCRYSRLPLILLVDSGTERIRGIQQGPFDYAAWAEVLVRYSRCAGITK